MGSPLVNNYVAVVGRTAMEAGSFDEAIRAHQTLVIGNFEGIASWLQGVRHLVDLAKSLTAPM